MARYTITPWRTPTDLLLVRAQLYRLNQDPIDTRRQAVNRILAWKLRGNLPHAIESTALLIDAQLHHHQTPQPPTSNKTSSSNSNFSIRATYTAAFSRFVTGFCDIGRSRENALVPSSMMEIARQIDMPADFVALRHEATHEELPSLQRLVVATERALEWLWGAYWSRLEEPPILVGANAESLSAVKDEARQILRAFRAARRQAFRANTQRTPEHRAQLEAFGKACVDLYAGGDRAGEVLVEVLVEDKLLIPSNHELGASIAGALALWSDLLLHIITKQNTFLTALARQLVHANTQQPPISADDDEDTDKDALYLWLCHLVTWRALPNSILDSLRAELMKSCCLYPSYWTQKLGARLLIDARDEHFRDDWEALFKASTLQAGIANDIEADGGSEKSGNVSAFERERTRMMGVDELARENVGTAEEGVGGWRRAAIAPRMPIGVVG